MRSLSTETRLRIDSLIKRLSNGELVTLEERIMLKKYSLHIPFIAGKIEQALRKARSQ